MDTQTGSSPSTESRVPNFYCTIASHDVILFLPYTYGEPVAHLLEAEIVETTLIISHFCFLKLDLG